LTRAKYRRNAAAVGRRYQEITDEHAAGENSECRAHDNLNAIPQAASIGDKAAA
jgi:hypothetical protein